MENVSNHPELELDPTSDRYRICPHPNCKKPHMARNRGKDYCCRQHADDHYNMLRRLKRQAELDQAARALLAERAAILLREEELAHAAEPNLQEEGVTPAAELTRTQEHEQRQPQVPSLEKNLEILNTLSLDPVHGSVFQVRDLLERGFDFTQYSAVTPNYNIPDGLVSNYVAYGDFRAYYIDPEKILIINKP